MTSFHTLGLAEPITRALAEERYSTPTPIQSAAIPPVLAGRDLVGIAQTGTGKTAAFALPILNRLAADPSRPEPKTCRVLVLCPTRELGGQIVDSFHTYGRHVRVSTMLAIGGVPIGKQVRALARGVDVLVATPGRLIDLHNNRAIRFDRVGVLVLDEADRMLDMGFIHDIRRIVALLPANRQTLFFSATMPPEITRLASQMLTDPVTVAVTPSATTVAMVDQRAIRIDREGKPALLAAILAGGEPVDRALVFTRTKHGADRVVRSLVQSGIPAEAMHGNKTQGNRERTMAAFRSGRIRILVATDIAARGIDVDGISHVINYDLPNIPETYVHRIGRTARAGATGFAISLISSDEMPFLRAIERLIRLQVPLTGGDRNWDAVSETRERPGRQRSGQHRQARSADGAAQKRVPRRGDKRRQKYEQPRGEAGSARSRPDQGIGGIGFMNKPRRPGMQQGSASRPR
ncbi:MAG: DEAD/DEAH box helicase [Bauldia sp.]